MKETLRHLQSTYKSIDLNIACALYEDRWFNFLTLLRFTYEDFVSLNKQMAENANLTQLSRGTRFRIHKTPISVEELPKLQDDFLNCSMKINDTTIHYDSPLDVKNFDLSLMRHSPPWLDRRWAEYFTYRSGKNNAHYRSGSFCDSLKSEVIPYGAKDIFEAIRYYFNYKEYDQSSVSDFIVIAPVYARIENIELEGKKVEISARYHKNLTGLVLHYGRRKSLTSQESLFGPVVYDQTKGIVTEETDFKIWQIEAEELDITDESYAGISCYIRLFFQPLSEEVSSLQKNVTEIIAEKRLLQTNPLARVFAKFCPIEKLEQILTNPTKISESGLTLSDTSNFERAVQWLFSLCGFSAIWLGKDTETITDEQKRPAGSTDLLCYTAKEKALAIVDCKTGIPNDKDINLIKNLADKFRSDVEEFGIRVVPIIVSSQPCDAVKQTGSANNVDIIDVNDLMRIIAKVYEVPPTPGLLLRNIRTSSTIGI